MGTHQKFAVSWTDTLLPEEDPDTTCFHIPSYLQCMALSPLVYLFHHIFSWRSYIWRGMSSAGSSLQENLGCSEEETELPPGWPHQDLVISGGLSLLEGMDVATLRSTDGSQATLDADHTGDQLQWRAHLICSIHARAMWHRINTKRSWT